MDADLIKIGLQVAGFVMTIAVGLYSWSMSRDKATQQEIKELHSEVEALGTRVVSIEKDIEHLPDRDSLHRQELAISEMKGDMSTMAEAFKAISRTVHRVEEFLMERSQK